MPKAIINALEDVSEPLRAEYRPGTTDEGLDGKFVLKVEGQDGWALENVGGLKTALSQERTAHGETKASFKKFEGMDADKAKSALAKIAELGTLDPKKDMDRLVEEKVQSQLTQLNERHEGEKSGLAKRLGARDALLSSVYKTEAALKAIAGEKGDVDLLLPHVLPSIDFSIDEDETNGQITPRVKVVDAQGHTRLGQGTNNMTIEERVREMKADTKFARLFDGSGHQGSGDRGNGGNGGGSGGNTGAKKVADMTRKEKASLIGEIGQQAYNERANAERQAAA